MMAESAGVEALDPIADVSDRFDDTTSRQFEVWTACFNSAIATMGGTKGVAKVLRKPSATQFTTEDRISVSYWYPIGSLTVLYGRRHDLRKVSPKKEFSEPLVTMGDFVNICRGGFQKQTLKRYINDLVHVNLLKKKGRGDDTEIMIAVPAVHARVETQKKWAIAFRPVINDMFDLGMI